MDGTFGTRLRFQRERQQVPLTVIAEQTKIKMSLLEGLERDDVSQWPMGIFRRSFVRAYAHAIGLEPDAVLREFLELHPEPVEEDIPSILAAARDSRRPPTRLGYLISSAISALPAVRVPGARAWLAADFATHPSAADDARAIPPDPAAGAPAVVTAIANEMNSPCQDDDGDGSADERPLYTPGPVDPAVSDPGAAPEPAGVCRALHRESAGVEREVSQIAALCTRLALALHPRDVAPVLEDAAGILGAAGLSLWMWDPATRALRHVLAHGYPDDVLARLPRVCYDADNAIADAFRAGETRVVKGCGLARGAVVVPIVNPAGCSGVFALELQDGGEERESVRALATILAAQLAMLFGFAALAEAVGA